MSTATSARRRLEEARAGTCNVVGRELIRIAGIVPPQCGTATRFAGFRYYQYRHYTERFGQNTEYLEAALKLDEWIRTGPKPD